MRRQQKQLPVEQAEAQVLQLITPTQQRFIEALLVGCNLSRAASHAGISRRTAHYWMNDPTNPVYKEYEKQLAILQQETAARVSSIRTKALQALEELLSPESPPFLRLSAVRMVYDAGLQGLFAPQEPQSAIALVGESAQAYHKESWEIASNQIYLYDEKGKERIRDDE